MRRIMLPLFAGLLALGAAPAARGDRDGDDDDAPSCRERPEPFRGPYTQRLNQPEDYFSQTVPESDAKFVEACGRAGGRLEHRVHPFKGAQGEPLRTSICHQGPGGADNVLLTISGTHGIEGYAGSAAQIGLLMSPGALPLPRGWRAVHIHQINPYGASFVLKENEDDADLSKNYSGLYDQGINNPILVEFIDLLDIPRLDDPAVQAAAQNALPTLFAKYGPGPVLDALKLGQGRRPIGIGYFGPGKARSTEILEEVGRRSLRRARNVVLLDFHTAVGAFGTWTVLTPEADSDRLWRAWLAGSGAAVQPTDVPSGARPAYELVRQSPRTRLIRGTVEAGTYDQADFQAYLVLNFHCRYFQGGWESPLCQLTRQKVREYFYPQSAAWRAQTWATFQRFMAATLRGMATL